MDRPKAHLDIDGWRSGVRFAASHVVPGHPKCGRLHGHTYAIHCRIDGDVPDNGMVMDFGIVKRVLRTIADELDHHWMLPRSPAEGTVDETEAGDVTYDVGPKHYRVPREDVIFLDVPVCTAEYLAHYVADRLMKEAEFPPEVARIEIGVDEGYGKGAWVVREP